MGKKGAGLRFLEIFRTYSHSQLEEVSFIVSRKAEKSLGQIDSKTRSTFSISGLYDLLLSPLILLHQFWILVATTKLQKRHFLFVMPSPSDFFFLLLLRALRMPCSFIIHDPDTHSGEVWPTSRSIRFRVRIAYKIYVLSKYTQEELKKNYAVDSIMLDHPTFPISLRNEQFTFLHELENYFLFIGRIRDYKGVPDLIDAFHRSESNFGLIIAGEGDFQKPANENIILLNRWLSDFEIESLIAGSSAVIFPYRDASQSGVIPICVSLQVPMIVSDAGALVEQASAGKLIGSFEAGNVKSLAELIIKAEVASEQTRLKGNLDFQKAHELSKQSSESFVRKLLLSLL
jgi:glycosyltransferase involved in cell wall biosynthesis